MYKQTDKPIPGTTEFLTYFGYIPLTHTSTCEFQQHCFYIYYSAYLNTKDYNGKGWNKKRNLKVKVKDTITVLNINIFSTLIINPGEWYRKALNT